MPRKLIKRYLPEIHHVRDHKHLRVFGTLLHDPRLWHLNRRSVAGAVAAGLFMAFVPIPFQMVPAAALAILFRVNILISVALVWITNPLTLPFFTYVSYKLGSFILQGPVREFAFEASWDWMVTELRFFWQPFVFGAFLLSSLSALVGYFSVNALWRLHVIKAWKRRKRFRLRGLENHRRRS